MFCYVVVHVQHLSDALMLLGPIRGKDDGTRQVYSGLSVLEGSEHTKTYVWGRCPWLDYCNILAYTPAKRQLVVSSNLHNGFNT